MAKTLSEKLKRLEQTEARSAAARTKLGTAARIARRKYLYRAAETVEQAGLLEWNKARLLGFLSEGRAADQKSLERWEKLGQALLDREEAEKRKAREPLVITFPDAIPQLTAAALRKAGFRWNKIFQHWEGLADFAEAEELAAANGGKVRRVRADNQPTALAAD